MDTITERLYQQRCWGRALSGLGWDPEKMWHGYRHGEKMWITICCELQRKLEALVRKQERFRAAIEYALRLPPRRRDLSRLLEDWNEERRTMGEVMTLLNGDFAKEGDTLRFYTRERRISQAVLSEEYAEMAASGKKLNKLQKMTKDCFVPAGEEYTFSGKVENYFELNDLSLDPVSSVRARLEGSCLFLFELE